MPADWLELETSNHKTFQSIDTVTIATKLRVSSNLRGLLTFRNHYKILYSLLV